MWRIPHPTWQSQLLSHLRLLLSKTCSEHDNYFGVYFWAMRFKCKYKLVIDGSLFAGQGDHVSPQVDQVLEVAFVFLLEGGVLHHQVEVLVEGHQFTLHQDLVAQFNRDLVAQILLHEGQRGFVAIHRSIIFL
jgi:hypothetical protein